MSEKQPFQLGLVMAGAVSAGSYTAGVVDFLLLALAEYQKARARVEYGSTADFPKHDVKLKVLTGASAGGMTAALTTASLVQPPPSGESLLHNAWVQQIDSEYLLTSTDLTDDRAPRSILNGHAIRNIAQEAIASTGTAAAIPQYIADPLDIVLTVSNVRGVPYGTTLSPNKMSPCEFLMHADWFHFAVGKSSPSLWPPSKCPPGPTRLPLDSLADPAWQSFKDAAVATGAFPLALPSIRLNRSGVTAYDVFVRRLRLKDCAIAREEVTPAFPSFFQSPNQPYEFDAVDGGMINNEPVDLARQALGIDLFQRHSKSGEAALILVAPFPKTGVFSQTWPAEEPSLVDSVGMVLGTLLDQARFQPEEMNLALDPNVDTQFMISPERKGRDTANAATWIDIACGSLDGFGGFLHQSFREHDYQLGRRNCQKFLLERFALHAPVLEGGSPNHKLFGSWNPPPRAKGVEKSQLPENDARRFRADEHNAKDEVTGIQTALPIIPLFGEALREQKITVDPWNPPLFTPEDVDRVQKKLSSRLRDVIKSLAIGTSIPGFLMSLAARPLANWAAGKAMRNVTSSLRRYGLYR